jgi:uncharacterized protein (DUF952 family)
MNADRLVHKICTEADWAEAQRTGAVPPSADDWRDGFIHLSSGAQVAATAAKHFAGAEDLLLLAVESERGRPDLEWERSRGADLFPHLYSPLPVEAVAWARPMPLGDDGLHRLPELA